MELRQLKHFVALSETLNFHRAAEVLNMSQPPLSVSIRKLEQELGAALFERQPRGVASTEAARAALPHARGALAAIEALSQAVKETASGARARLRIGFVGSATYRLVPAIVPEFRCRHPKIELSLKEATSLEIMRAIERGEMDAGLVRTPLLDVSGAVLEPLYKEELILIVPKDHRLAGVSAVRLEDLKDELFVVYDRLRVPNLWALTIMSCESAGFLPKIAEEAPHIHTVIALVESGLGVALAPAIMRRAAGERVHCLRLTADGAALQIGFALATRAGDSRRALLEFAAVARSSAATTDS